MANIVSSTGVKQQLGKKIQCLRMARGWSQEVLAELAGLHRNYIGHVERAEVNAGLVNMEKIAQAFQISVHELLNMDAPGNPPSTEDASGQVYKLGVVDAWKSPPSAVSRVQRK